MFKLFLWLPKRPRIHPQDRAFARNLRELFGVWPQNLGLYRVALTHKSASMVSFRGRKMNNERLECLGDAVLDAIVTDFLFIAFPTQSEGFITKIRSRIVSRQSLNTIALAAGIDRLMANHTKNSLAQKHIFGDALEALLGAVYLDLGFKAAKNWVYNRLFLQYIDLDEVLVTETDYKSRLVEWCQKHKATVQFNCAEMSTSTRKMPQFEAHILINGTHMGSGIGNSKKEAEQNASQGVLEQPGFDFNPNIIEK